DGRPARIEIEARASDGRRMALDLQILPLRDAEGRVTLLMASAVDGGRRAGEGPGRPPGEEEEAEARRQLAELRSIYDHAPIGLSVMDLDLRWVRVNDRLAEINGIPAEAHI